MAGRWVRIPRPDPRARVRLYCIPHAGGGASTFRTWPGDLPAGIEVRSVQLPGREDRIAETPFRDAPAAAVALADAIGGELSGSWALFGHSMGALIGFELLRELRRRDVAGPARFFVSGHRAPQFPDSFESIHELPDAEFLDALDSRYSAVPPAVRESEELLELLLPGLRADVAVCDTYVHERGEPLECPIDALGGTDDPAVSRESLEAWHEQTSGPFRVTMLEGDHFYLQTRQAELLRIVGEALRPSIG